MTVVTKAYGPMEADERQRISFPKGLPGFAGLREFALLNARQEPFFYLQSLEDPDVAFVLIDPFIFRPDFELEVSDEELKGIGVERPSDALVMAIVTVPANGGAVTANLMGPLLIGRKSRLAFQAILGDPRWRTKHDIKRELAETGEGRMLILSRKLDERIVIGDDIEVIILEIHGDQVKLGVKAPREVKVFRREVFDAIQAENRAAASSAGDIPALSLPLGRG